MHHREPAEKPDSLPQPAAGVRIVAADTTDAADVLLMIREIAAQQGAPAIRSADEPSVARALADPALTVLLAVTSAVAGDRHEPIGFVAAVRRADLASRNGAIVVDQWYVRPAARGIGVGTALIRALAARADGTPIRWDLAEGDIAGQRSAVALGAKLRRAVIASWHGA